MFLKKTYIYYFLLFNSRLSFKIIITSNASTCIISYALKKKKRPWEFKIKHRATTKNKSL